MCFVLSVHFYGIFGFEKNISSSNTDVLNNLNEDIENEIDKKNDNSISRFDKDSINTNGNNINKSQNSGLIDENENNESDLIFTYNLKSGSSASKVADELYNLNIISSKDEFLKILKNKSLENALKVGSYQIKKGSSIEDIIKKLTK